jgi:hypothetical protein
MIRAAGGAGGTRTSEPLMTDTANGQEVDPAPAEDAEARRPPAEPADLLAEALLALARRALRGGRRRAALAAQTSRKRLELRQLQRDRDAFWGRLGKTAYRLVQAGELDHPALRRAMERIDELEARIAEVETEDPATDHDVVPTDVARAETTD